MSRLLDRPLDESTLDLIAAALFPDVERARGASQQLAQRYYADALAAHDLGDPVRAPRLKPYELAALREGLARTLTTGSDQVFTRRALGLALNLASKHVEDAGRRSMMASVFDDDRVSGWARSDPSPPTCAFCLMLISRGPVYKSRETAGGRTQWHAGCSCKAVPVIRGDWEGRNQYAQADQLWRESTRGVHHDPLNAFRTAIANESSALPRAA